MEQISFEDYKEFVVKASDCTVDEVSFRLLRAAAGLVAELDEFCNAGDAEDYEQEQGDVVFWLTVLKCWVDTLNVTPIKPAYISLNILDSKVAMYILDRVEKYSRARDKSRLSGVAWILEAVFLKFQEGETNTNVASLPEIMSRNYNKLTAKPRETA